jgi:putative membrane protein
MIVRRNFRIERIVPYVWKELVFVSLLAVAAWRWGFSLPFAPLGVLGTALAILLGFRNNTAYARWWEARTAWAGIVNNSRNLTRQINASIENAIRLNKGGGRERVEAFRREIVLRQIAFANALRLRLRGQPNDALAAYLAKEEWERVRTAQNVPNLLLHIQTARIKDGVREEMIGQFDPIVIEPNLAAFNNWQAACERIRDTPLLRPYDYFTRVFVWLFLTMLPPSLMNAFGGKSVAVVVSIAIGFVYAITHKVGLVNEDPFENKSQDVPMTAICAQIERDLREQLGDAELPPEAKPVDGYLY